jgi:DNA-binding winged helix-turn-helix (wHTH) protein/Tol biopolymer transport system component
MQHVIYEFGPFHLDESQRVLFSGDHPVSIPPKELDTLVILLRNHGRVVDKQQLMDSVWPNVFVEEGNLARHISYLRRRLGDSASGGQYVETVPKRGYRFVAPVVMHNVNGAVQKVNGTSAAAAAHPASSLAPDGVVIEEVGTGVRGDAGKRLRLYGLAAAALAIAIAAGIWTYVSLRPEPAPFEQMTMRRLTDSGDVVDAAISPDGKYMVYAYQAGHGSQSGLCMKHLPTNSTAKVVSLSAGRFTGVTFAPDGDHVYFVRVHAERPGVGVLYRVPVLGGPATQIAVDVDSPVSFSPDGKHMVFSRDAWTRGETMIVVAKSDGTEEQAVARRHVPADYIGFPTWDSSDDSILVYARSEPDATATLERIAVKSRKASSSGRWNLRRGQVTRIRDAGWATAVMEASQLRGQVLFMDKKEPETIRPITTDLNDYDFHLTATKDGKNLLVVRQNIESQVWVEPYRASGAGAQVTRSEESLNDVRWVGASELLTLNMAGTLALRKANGGEKSGIAAPPVVEVDAGCDHGRYLVYSAMAPNTTMWRIYVANRDGSDPRAISQGKADRGAACSPVGREVYFVGQELGKTYIKKTTLDGGKEEQVLPLYPQLSRSGQWDLGEWRMQVSPDGKRLLVAYFEGEQVETFRHKIGVYDFAEKRFVFTMDADFGRFRGGRFTPDGKALVLSVHDDADTGNLWLQPIGPGERTQLTAFGADRILGFDFSPDGTKVALVRGRKTRDAVLISDVTNPR